jgi:hypothetical protein
MMGSTVLYAAQKKYCRSAAIEPLKLLRERDSFDFNGITTGAEPGSSITASFEECLRLRENKSLLMFELSYWFKRS